MPDDKPWMLSSENNPSRRTYHDADKKTYTQLPPLRELVEGRSADGKKPKMFGVRLYASDAELLRSMDVKPSDFIREAVHEALNKIRAAENQAD